MGAICVFDTLPLTSTSYIYFWYSGMRISRDCMEESDIVTNASQETLHQPVPNACHHHQWDDYLSLLPPHPVERWCPLVQLLHRRRVKIVSVNKTSRLRRLTQSDRVEIWSVKREAAAEQTRYVH